MGLALSLLASATARARLRLLRFERRSEHDRTIQGLGAGVRPSPFSIVALWLDSDSPGEETAGSQAPGTSVRPEFASHFVKVCAISLRAASRAQT